MLGVCWAATFKGTKVTSLLFLFRFSSCFFPFLDGTKRRENFRRQKKTKKKKREEKWNVKHKRRERSSHCMYKDSKIDSKPPGKIRPIIPYQILHRYGKMTYVFHKEINFKISSRGKRDLEQTTRNLMTIIRIKSKLSTTRSILLVWERWLGKWKLLISSSGGFASTSSLYRLEIATSKSNQNQRFREM